jgi:recombinational DNA repair protein (RecF pathway)
MSFKGKVLVLKRVRSGDQDLIAKAYSQGGVVSILVREGYAVSNPFFGIFEPFNLVEADLDQRGDVLVPNDVLSVRRFSLLAREYRRYVWMCWVSLFVLRKVKLYDERVFSLLVRYITLDPGRRAAVYRVLFRLEVIDALGWRPKFLDQSIGGGRVRVSVSDGSLSEEGGLEVSAGVLRSIRELMNLGAERVSLRGRVLRKVEEFLDTYIDYHVR